MARDIITESKLRDHVDRLAEQHPPIPLATVDRTVRNPELVRRRFGHVIEYLARVELEVDRNVLELLVLLPEPREVDRYFYADVWQPQEIQHGLIIDQLGQDIGMQPSEPLMQVQLSMKLLGALSHIPAIGEVSRLLYYLTGASTERQAVLAYNTLSRAMQEVDEPAVAETVIGPIKKQEPGHFAFYQMSATEMVQSGVLRPWQLWLARQLRRLSYELVGVDGRRDFAADMGGVMTSLGIDHDLIDYARQIGRLEARLLWANRAGMEFPPYVLSALRDCLDQYRRETAARAASAA